MSLKLENKPQILNLHVKLSQKEKDWFGEKKKKKESMVGKWWSTIDGERKQRENFTLGELI